jgi:ribosomal protein S18 acetylase RimI-like enzyme
MYYRRSGASSRAGDANRRALRWLVGRGVVPGLIGYESGNPVAWVSLGPREDYERLGRSPVMKAVDDLPVWSIVCFYVDPKARGMGAAEAMLRGAITYARSQGARLLEAYPVDKPGGGYPDWFGGKAMFDRSGFQEVARRKETRPVMRRRLQPTRR